MARKVKKLTSLTIAFMVVCLVAASFPQFHVLTPPPVMANPDTAGPNIASTASGTNWTTPGNTTSSDDAHAHYKNTAQDDLQLTNFGFNIPADSVIEGIVITREGHGTGATAVKRQFRIGLTKDGSTLVGTRKIGQNLPQDFDDTVDIGNASDLWGTTWTVAEINATTFGVLISDNDTTKDDLNFDYVAVTIHYRPTIFNRAANQGITITDGVTATPITLREVAQGITVSDGVTGAVERGRNISQGITITDGVTAVVARERNISQGITITDGVTAVAGTEKNVSQGITITDGVTAVAGTERNVSQGITITDGVTAVVARGRNISQGITITDGVTVSTGTERNINQGITITDGVTTVVAQGRNISQGITITDGVTAVVARERNVGQGITISDGVGHCCERTCATSQGITISDGVTATPAAYRPVTQGITVSDGVTAAVERGRNISQGITISDGVAAIAASTRNIGQGITISDGVTVVAGTERNVSQGITISDGVTAVPVTYRPVTQGITISDGVMATVTTGTPPTNGGGGEVGGDTTPPTFSNILASSISETTAGIAWRTNEPSTSQVEYWTSPGILSPLDQAMVTSHHVQLIDLTPGTSYHYKTMSRDAWGNLAVSDEYTFDTLEIEKPPAPAAFSLSNLSIQPAEVQPQEAVTITVSVANTGGREGSYTAVLKIKGVDEAEKKVTVAAGDSRSVSFSVSREDAGSYSVVVGELSGSFTIVALPAPPVAPALNWPLLGGAVAAVWGLLIFLGRRKISPLAHAAWPKLRALVALLAAVRLKIVPFTRHIISSFANTAWPKLRALVALLMAVRLKIAPFTRHIISSFAHTALPKFRAFVALLVAVRLKIAPFTRRIISSLISRVKH